MTRDEGGVHSNMVSLRSTRALYPAIGGSSGSQNDHVTKAEAETNLLSPARRMLIESKNSPFVNVLWFDAAIPEGGVGSWGFSREVKFLLFAYAVR
jgi:hypothetical protein